MPGIVNINVRDFQPGALRHDFTAEVLLVAYEKAGVQPKYSFIVTGALTAEEDKVLNDLKERVANRIQQELAGILA